LQRKLEKIQRRFAKKRSELERRYRLLEAPANKARPAKRKKAVARPAKPAAKRTKPPKRASVRRVARPASIPEQPPAVLPLAAASRYDPAGAAASPPGA